MDMPSPMNQTLHSDRILTKMTSIGVDIPSKSFGIAHHPLPKRLGPSSPPPPEQKNRYIEHVFTESKFSG